MPANSTLEVFKNVTFRNLWLASLTSNLGGLIQLVGAAWMMALLTSSESMVALVQTSITLPMMLFALVSGVLADSFDRRKVMLLAQTAMLFLSLFLAVLAIFGTVTPWLLLGFSFLIGCGTTLHSPSWQASVGDIVEREHLPTAVATNAMGFNIVRSVGPAVGGVIVATLGAAAAFLVNAVSYVAMIVALWRWRPKQLAQPLPREPFGRAFAAGVRYVAMSPFLLRVVLRSTLFGLSAISIQALLPIVVKGKLGGDALVYGVLLGCFGMGAVIGGLSSARLRARFSIEQIVRTGFLGTAACAAVVGSSTSIALTALAMIVAGSFWLTCMSLFNTTLQMSTPRWVVGRVLSQFQMGAFGGMAVGAWIWGLLAEQLDLTTSMVLSAVALVLGGLLGLFSPLENLSSANLDPLDRFREPPIQLDLTQRSGPIMIMVEYQIDQGDVHDFLLVMARRRHSRLRDGARNWTLLRDLEKPNIWIESYHVSTWVEYVRHHARRTKADADIAERLMALHRGEGPLRVHRMIERQTVPEVDDAPPRMTDTPFH